MVMKLLSSTQLKVATISLAMLRTVVGSTQPEHSSTSIGSKRDPNYNSTQMLAYSELWGVTMRAMDYRDLDDDERIVDLKTILEFRTSLSELELADPEHKEYFKKLLANGSVDKLNDDIEQIKTDLRNKREKRARIREDLEKQYPHDDRATTFYRLDLVMNNKDPNFKGPRVLSDLEKYCQKMLSNISGSDSDEKKDSEEEPLRKQDEASAEDYITLPVENVELCTNMEQKYEKHSFNEAQVRLLNGSTKDECHVELHADGQVFPLQIDFRPSETLDGYILRKMRHVSVDGILGVEVARLKFSIKLSRDTSNKEIETAAEQFSTVFEQMTSISKRWKKDFAAKLKEVKEVTRPTKVTNANTRIPTLVD